MFKHCFLEHLIRVLLGLSGCILLNGGKMQGWIFIIVSNFDHRIFFSPPPIFQNCCFLLPFSILSIRPYLFEWSRNVFWSSTYRFNFENMFLFLAFFFKTDVLVYYFPFCLSSSILSQDDVKEFRKMGSNFEYSDSLFPQISFLHDFLLCLSTRIGLNGWKPIFSKGWKFPPNLFNPNTPFYALFSRRFHHEILLVWGLKMGDRTCKGLRQTLRIHCRSLFESLGAKGTCWRVTNIQK